MTTFVRANFLLVFLSIFFLSSNVKAGSAVFWPDVPWRSDKLISSEIITTLHVVPLPSKLIAGITPSIAEVVADVRRSAPHGVTLSRQDVADALARTAKGCQGPLLVISDGVKMRVMELRAKDAAGEFTVKGH
ncbi:MAG: hypothetical protein HQL17_06050 [Candidatus Omnitrophica bacterium]|nr:hypothetical protein [Candidatus Omnitrophota bacterium]